MGTKTRTETLDPVTEWMIDRYVEEALAETGTAARASPSLRGRFARGSKPPRSEEDFLAPPPLELHADPDSPEFGDEAPTDLTDFADEEEEADTNVSSPRFSPALRPR